MDQAVKVRWVEALRSGQYKQGRIYLHAEGEFCCLGVLCELAVQDGVVVRFEREDVSYSTPSGLPPGSDGRSIELPTTVAAWADFRRPDRESLTTDGTFPIDRLSEETRALLRAKGWKREHRELTDLTELNDFGIGFDLIARIIEEVWS